MTPELWDPLTGEIFELTGAVQSGEQTELMLEFAPAGSWFVVFRENTTPGRTNRIPFPAWDTLREITGEWKLEFDPQWGSSDTLTLDSLSSWSEHSDSLVKFYSGTGTYGISFDYTVSPSLKNRKNIYMDLGKVEVVARVKLNGRDCGIAWKPPYRVDITGALQDGHNELQLEVANTWTNRMIGDEYLPLDDSWQDWEVLLEWPDWFKEGRKSPTGRYTFTSARHYNTETKLLPSGLLGPVHIITASTN